MTSSVDGTATYSYDTTNQVTAASYTGTNQPANEANSFDKNGNRTNTGYTTGANNQLTSDGTFNYTYDHEGNRLTRTRISSAQANDYETTYTWDYRNRLTDVEYFNNSGVLTKHVHYVYDVYDHLIGMQFDPSGGGTYTSSEWYALDLAANPNAPALPVLQFNGSGNETYRFLNGPTAGGVDSVMGVLGQEAVTIQGSAGTTTYALADNLGSVRDIANTSSVVVDHIVYNSFGNVVYESGTVAHWAGYAGYHTDANTGLDYADHRWYDPVVGRWISEDPLGFRGGDPNVSRYVGNSPTNRVDPTGLQAASGSGSTYTLCGPSSQCGPTGTFAVPLITADPGPPPPMPPSPYSVGNQPPTLAQVLAWNDAMGVWAQDMEAWTQKEIQYMQSKGYGGTAGPICTPCNMYLVPFQRGGVLGPPQPITFPVAGGQNQWIKLKAFELEVAGEEKKEKEKMELKFKGTFVKPY